MYKFEIIVILVILAILGGIGFTACEQHKREKVLIESAIGLTEKDLMVILGPPSEQVSPDTYTKIVAWKKYHEGSTTYINSNNVMIPVHHPAYVSGYKAVFVNGVCTVFDSL